MNQKIVIPEPCHENWANMSQTEKGRFCSSCSKEVVDFTRRDKSAIIEFVQKADERVCGRFNPHQVDVYGNSPSTSKSFSTGWVAGILAFLGLIFPGKESKAQKMGKVAIKGEAQIIDAHPVLKRDVAITGTLRNSLGDRIANATVNLWSGNKLVASTKSIANGRYSFQLSPGILETEDVLLEVLADDYEAEQRQLLVDKIRLTADFTLGQEIFILGEIAWDPEDTLDHLDEVMPEVDELIMGDTVIQCSALPEKATQNLEGTENYSENDTEEGQETQSNDEPEIEEKAGSIAAREEDVEVVLWPNPGNGLLQVNFRDVAGWQYEVLDNLGKQISSGWSNQSQKEINVTYLPAGQYFLRLTPYGQPEGVRTVRFIRE